jgi:hypothetical protein
MIDDAAISRALEAASDRRTASALGRDLRPLRGLRGVPLGELARQIDAVWREGVDLDEDAPALDRLFAAAWDDGILAIGLVSGALPDAPDAAWDLAIRWLQRVDDVMTADTLGWLVLGPAVLAGGVPGGLDALLALARPTSSGEPPHPAVRRAVVSAGLAMLPEPIEGPAAAALRARLDMRHLALVGEAHDAPLAALATAFVRDNAPPVQKGLRRVLRRWTHASPAAVAAWGAAFPGGLPKLLGAEVLRARRRAARLARELGEGEE